MEMELPNFDTVMTELASRFQEELIASLERPYPFAPGYKNQRAPFGTSPKRATGDLISSISVEYNSSNQEIVVSMAEYWKYVNDGRKPGKYAPLDSIESWIKAKGLKGRNKKTGRFITNKSFAWGINTNIKKFGIAPTYFYDKAFEGFEKYFEDEAVKALGIDIETFFERVFETNK